MEKNEQELQGMLNLFAAHALQALITKLPLLDREGEMGEMKSQEEIEQIKRDLTSTAWGYAQWMLHHSEKAHAWVSENAIKTTTP